MAKVAVTTKASPDAVFNLLADPDTYPRWLIGAKHIRGKDGEWPEVGSRFHHRVGLGPFALSDSTKVLESEPPSYLALEVNASKAVKGIVRFWLREGNGGTEVEMEEEPAHRFIGNLVRPVLDPLTHVRNALSLRRLVAMAVRADRS